MKDLDEYRRRHREAYEIRQKELENKILIEKEKESLELAKKLQEEENQKERQTSDEEEISILNSVYDAKFDGIRPPDSSYKEQLIEGSENNVDNSFEMENVRSANATKDKGISSAKFRRKENNTSLTSSTKDRNIGVDDGSSHNIDDEEYARKLQEMEYKNFYRKQEKKEIINENEKIKGSDNFLVEIISDDEVELKDKTKENNVKMKNTFQKEPINNHDNAFLSPAYSSCYSSDSFTSKLSTSYAYKNEKINNDNNTLNSNNNIVPRNHQNNDCFVENEDVMHNDTLHSHAFLSDDADEAMLQAAIVESLNDL